MENVNTIFSTPRRVIVNKTMAFDRGIIEQIKSDISIEKLTKHIIDITDTVGNQLESSTFTEDVYLQWGNSPVTVEVCTSLKRLIKDNDVTALNKLFITVMQYPTTSDTTFAKRWAVLVNIAKLLYADFPKIYVKTYFCGINKPVFSKPLPDELTTSNECSCFEDAKKSIGKWIIHICDATGRTYTTPVFNKILSGFPYNAVVSMYSSDADEVSKGMAILNEYCFAESSRKIAQEIPYGNDILDETSSSMCAALYDFLDVISNPMGAGLDILKAIRKDLDYLVTEERTNQITRNLIKMFPTERYDLVDMPLFCKDVYIELVENVKITKVQGNADGYIVNMDTLEDAILNCCKNFMEYHGSTLTFSTFKKAAKVMFDYALCQCKHSAFTKYHDEINNIFSNALKKMDTESSSLHTPSMSADFLLDFIRDSSDDTGLSTSTESSFALESKRTKDVFKADSNSRIGNANAPERKQHTNRADDGKFTKKEETSVEDDKKNDETFKRSKYQKSRGDTKLGVSREYQIFKQNSRHILHQINNILPILKDFLLGKKEIETMLIEGKHWTLTGLLKKLLGGVSVFAFAGVGKGILFLIIRACARGKVKRAERRKIIMMIEEELAIIDEKINDAASDGDREAKYALMRSKQQLEHAIKRLKYGYEAERDDSAAMKALSQNVAKGE